MARRPLRRPEFVSEMPPTRSTTVKPPLQYATYEPTLEILRKAPGKLAKIAEFKVRTSQGRGAKDIQKEAAKTIRNLRIYVRLAHPGEVWNFHAHLVRDTWGDREIYASYDGFLGPEEWEAHLKARQAAFGK